MTVNKVFTTTVLPTFSMNLFLPECFVHVAERYWHRPVLSVFIGLLLSLQVSLMAQTPVPLASQPNYSYTATFADIANWTNNFASGIEANRCSSVATGGANSIPNPNRITTATNTFVTFSSGGVQKGVGADTEKIVLLTTGTTDNTTSSALDFFINFTGLNAGQLQFDANTVFDGTLSANRKGTLKVYASVNGTTFTDLGINYVVTTNVTGSALLSVALPCTFNNSSAARLRFYYFNGGTSPTRRLPVSVSARTMWTVRTQTILTASGSFNTLL